MSIVYYYKSSGFARFSIRISNKNSKLLMFISHIISQHLFTCPEEKLKDISI